MKLVPYDLNEAGAMKYKRTKWLNVLEEFSNGEYDCVMVMDYSNESAKSCCDAIKASIKRFKFNSIEAFTRKGNVFLVKKSAIK